MPFLYSIFYFNKGMLSEFRVNELKELLRKTSQSQRGRKAELFQRANELLRHGSPKIQLHIREIYQSVRPYRSPKRSSPAKACLRLAQQLAQQQSRQGYVMHPDVKFKPHPFFRLKEMIIRPTALGMSLRLYKDVPCKGLPWVICE